MKKLIALNLLMVLLSILTASLMGDAVPSASFLNTIYTIAGIMFSIGMGLICTFNLDRIKNPKFYKVFKKNIIDVRNLYIAYFGVISFGYILYQLFPNLETNFAIKEINIVVNLAYIEVAITVLSIIYFIKNFIAIQKLSFEINEKSSSTQT